jgi:hypothetical protein
VPGYNCRRCGCPYKGFSHNVRGASFLK